MLRMFRNERRQLRVTIKSSDKLPFTIQEARYEMIYRDGGGVIESQGECSIDGAILIITLDPKNNGLYTVRFIMKIADETVIRKICIMVEEL